MYLPPDSHTARCDRLPSTLAVVALAAGAVLFSPAPAAAQDPDLVYVPHVSVTESGGALLTTVEEQVTATLDALGEALRAEGLDYGDVVASNVFLKDARHFQAMNDIYRTYFQTDPPTRATVEADLLDPDALVQIAVVAARGQKRIIRPNYLRSPELPYSWGVQVGSRLFIAGATSRDPDTYQPVTGTAAVQTRRVFGNIGMILEEAGMNAGDLVSCRVFIDDPRDYGAMNEAYGQAVSSDDPPARATVRSGLMNPVFNSEIQCVADGGSERSVVRAEGSRRGSLPFSPAIDTGDRVYLSGMVGRGEDVEAKTGSVLDNLEATLAAAGLDFGDVEDVWVYLTDIRTWETVEPVLAARMPAGAPTPTVIGTQLVGDFDVEIQMTARR